MTKDRARAKAQKYLEWAEKAEAKSKELYANFQSVYKDFDWTQPILRGHHSQKAHEKIYARRNTMHEKVRELDEKAKRFREKASNLLAFANRNKGDADKKKQEYRNAISQVISIGSQVNTLYGVMEVIKINDKTVRCQRGEWKTTIDKNLIRTI